MAGTSYAHRCPSRNHTTATNPLFAFSLRLFTVPCGLFTFSPRLFTSLVLESLQLQNQQYVHAKSRGSTEPKYTQVTLTDPTFLQDMDNRISGVWISLVYGLRTSLHRREGLLGRASDRSASEGPDGSGESGSPDQQRQRRLPTTYMHGMAEEEHVPAVPTGDFRSNMLIVSMSQSAL